MRGLISMEEDWVGSEHYDDNGDRRRLNYDLVVFS